MKQIKNFETTIWLFFLFVCLLIVCIWFRYGNLFIGAEEGIVFYKINYIFERMVSTTWLAWFLGMPYFSDLSKYPFYFLLTTLFSWGISGFFLQVGTFIFILFTATIGSYCLFKVMFERIPESRFVAIIGALFYLWNPYIISQVWGRGLYQQFFAFAYYPFFLLLIVLYFKTNKVVFLLIDLVVAYFLSAAMGNPTYFISLWVLVSLYWLFQLIADRRDFKKMFYHFLLLIIFFVLWIIFNSWWLIVTLIYAPSTYINSVFTAKSSLESLQALSAQNPFIHVIRLYHAPHFESGLYGAVYKNFLFTSLSFLPLVVVFFSVRYFKNQSYKYFATLFLLGLFVCLGLNPPFGKLFELTFTYIPVLQIFRNPYEKFGLIFLLGYSALFGLGFLGLFKLIKYPIIKNILIIVTGLYFIVYLWPFWTGQMISWGTQSRIPTRYEDFDKWQKENNTLKQGIFFLPYLSSLGASYHWIGGDYHGNDPLFQMIDAPTVTQSGSSDYLNALKRYMGSMDLTSALGRIGVKYLVLRPDVVSTNRDKESTVFFTKFFYSPQKVNQESICENIVEVEKNHYSCEIASNQQDWTNINYINIEILTDQPGYLDVYLTDQNGLRPRWNGKTVPEYQYESSRLGEKQRRIIYLSDPTENPNTNFASIKKLDIYFKTNKETNLSAKVLSVLIEQGTEHAVRGVKYLTTVRDLSIYEVTNPKPVQNIQAFSNLKSVENYEKLFAKFNESSQSAFLIVGQNKQQPTTAQFKTDITISKSQVTENVVSLNGRGEYFIGLNQSFNSEWKLIRDVSPEMLDGSFINYFRLWCLAPESENQHFLINGFANGWIIRSTKDTESVAIVYKPQLILNFLKMLSFDFLCLISISIISYILLKYRRL